ncbi:Uncharacterized protein ABC855_g977 [[Candida] zeylanoides]
MEAHTDATAQQTCKKCELPIYEGHAYELGEDRWHIPCFKCSKCHTSLGCNSNFLVLGNGSLICSSCSYNCKQCGKKIDDLAILTGDQAYCSSCFKCRSCKERIEDLRYARTSKGLFCMKCHEKLIAKKKRYDRRQAAAAPAPPAVDEQPLRSQPLRNQPDGEALKSEFYAIHASSVSTQSLKNLPPPPGSGQAGPVGSGQAGGLAGASAGPGSAGPGSSVPLAPPAPGGASGAPPLLSRDSTTSQHTSTSYTSQGASELSTPVTESAARLEPQRPTLLNIVASPAASTATSVPRDAVDSFDIEEVYDSDEELRRRAVSPRRRYASPPPPASAASLGSARSYSPSLRTPPVDPSTPEMPAATLQPPPDLRPAETFSPHVLNRKNILIRSPNQFHDNAFHATRADAELDMSGGEIRSQAVAVEDAAKGHSPFARANRQARVVETNETEVEVGVASPPPKIPPPMVPSTPVRPAGSAPGSARLADTLSDAPHGLGLDIDYYDTLAVSPRRGTVSTAATPAVTNLEEAEPAPARKPSILRTPKLSIKHKRSTSGGKFGLFKGSKEEGHVVAVTPKSHSRHVSEGSINGSAFSTPPLPLASPRGSRDHLRSTSDTTTLEAEEMTPFARSDLEMRSIKLEIYQLDSQKQLLNADIKRLTNERAKLTYAARDLRDKISGDTTVYEILLKEIDQLKRERAKLEGEAAAAAQTAQTQAAAKAQEEAAAQAAAPAAPPRPAESSLNSYYVGDSASAAYPGAYDDDDAETNKATKLKFWRRPKLGFTAPAPDGRANGASRGDSVPPTAGSSQSEDGKGASFITKSRSTNILDTFLSSASLEDPCPLFTSTLQRRAAYENEAFPLIVRKCVEEVERRGLDMEGIYRISGGNSAIVAIETAFSGLPPHADDRAMQRLSETMAGDINAVTSALKRYLRKLPDPIIPYALYDDFIRVSQSNAPGKVEKRLKELRGVVQRLPAANRAALQALCRHLDLVNSYSHVNRMGFKNLSVVFAPTLARDESGQKEMIDMGYRNDVTDLMLCNYKRVFA